MYQVLKRRDRAIFADPDGGYLSKLYDPRFGDVILNPFDARSAKWNPLLDVDNAYEADLLANALIPGESEWNSYARTFLAAVIRQCKAKGVKDPAELWRLVSVASSDELRELLQGTAAQPFLEPDNGRMFGSLRSVASNAIARSSTSMRSRDRASRCGRGCGTAKASSSCRTRPSRSRP